MTTANAVSSFSTDTSPLAMPSVSGDLARKTLVSAPITEVFSSFQGEGPHIGERQVFVRFSHCHLHCSYCDTAMSQPDGQCWVETEPASGVWDKHPNPQLPHSLDGLVEQLWCQTPHHSVSLTGGEPLLYGRFLSQWLPLLNKPVYLETSGTHPAVLASIAPWVSTIAMDIKLPSATGEPWQSDAHREFIADAQENPQCELFIKLILNNAVTSDELGHVMELVSNRNIPVFVQPVTNPNGLSTDVLATTVFNAVQHLTRHFTSVRVIPQSHKLMGLT